MCDRTDATTHYEQPCPFCLTSSGWFVRGTRQISVCYNPDGSYDDTVEFPETDKAGTRAFCRREGCNHALRPAAEVGLPTVPGPEIGETT